jgi:hypothetical protein
MFFHLLLTTNCDLQCLTATYSADIVMENHVKTWMLTSETLKWIILFPAKSAMTSIY